MAFSVGVLYSAFEFLQFAAVNTFTAEEFSNEKRFALTKPHEILEVAQNCNWIQLTVEGRIILTKRGQAIVESGSSAAGLRCQIEDLIIFHDPPWASKIRHGRKETIPAMPGDVRQCFQECGLLDPWDKDILIEEWWGAASIIARTRRGEKLSKTGRTAERWSCDYESSRTGVAPERTYLDTNFAGYDVLSQLSDVDATPLPIEVKGSERRPKEADFVMTRNEFKAARDSQKYQLHLWYVGQPKQLFVVSFDEVAKHLPIDRGEGKWENVRVPFAPFMEFRQL